MYAAVQETPLPSDAALMPRFRALQDAARINDPLRASNLEDIINAGNAADVSATTGLIFRRCEAGGAT
jgi:hypothetical protein